MFGGFFTRPKIPNVSGEDFSLFFTVLFFNYFHCFHWHPWTIFNVLFTRDKHFFNVFSHATNVFFHTRLPQKPPRARGASGVREHCACGKHHCSGPWLRKKLFSADDFFHFAFSRAFYNCVLCFLFNPEADRQK